MTFCRSVATTGGWGSSANSPKTLEWTYERLHVLLGSAIVKGCEAFHLASS